MEEIFLASRHGRLHQNFDQLWYHEIRSTLPLLCTTRTKSNLKYYIVKKWYPDCPYLDAEMIIEQLNNEPYRVQKLSSVTITKLKNFISDSI
jgi:hypothetical protein